MKRILMTSVNSRFDEQLIEYFISRHYHIRILQEFLDPGSCWLKWPVEIYCCSPNDSNEMMQAIKGCDFIIATQFTPVAGFCKNSGEAMHLIPASPEKNAIPILKAVVYTMEDFRLAENIFSLTQFKYMNGTRENSQAFAGTSPEKNERLSFKVAAGQPVHIIENNAHGANSFIRVLEKMHETMRLGMQGASFIFQIKNNDSKISWKSRFHNLLESGLGRLLRSMRYAQHLMDI